MSEEELKELSKQQIEILKKEIEENKLILEYLLNELYRK